MSRISTNRVVSRWASSDKKNKAYVSSNGHLFITITSHYNTPIGPINLTLDPPKKRTRRKA